MNKYAVAHLLAVAFSLFSLAAGAATTTAKTISWSLPEGWEEGVVYEEVKGEGVRHLDIHGGDLNRRYGLGKVGEPDLPTYTVRVELPAGGTFVSAKLAEVEWGELQVKVEGEGEQRNPIPLPIAEWVRYGEKLEYPTPDPGTYEQAYPSEFVVAGTPDVYRGVTRVPITVTPYKWDGTTKTLYRAKRLRVEVEVKRTLKLTASSTANLAPQVIIVTPHDFVNHWNGYAAFRKSTEAGKDFEFIVKDTRTIYSDAKYWTKHCRDSQSVERDDNADALAIHHYLEDVYDPNRVQYVILGAAPTKYQYDRDSMIPARYVVNGGSYGGMVCDMYYGCMDRKDSGGNVIQKSAITEDSPEVWDYDCDGYYMGTKTASGCSNDPDKCVDWTMDVSVTRVPMMREYVENLNNTWHRETADDIMRHFTNNIAYAENPATWTRDKRWQHVLGGGYLFNYYDRGSDNEMVQGEHAFFDGGPNYFDPAHKTPAPDAETCPRQRHYQYFSRYRASRLALINTGGYVNTEFDDLYRSFGDVFTSQSHGLQRGSDPGRTHGALAATGLWRVFNMALPCDTGWYDYCPGGSYGITNCCCMGEAPLLCFNDHAGGLVTFNNSRYAYWGGFDGASSKMEGLIDKALYELDMNVGDACRYMHNNCGYTGGGQSGWVNLEVIMHGDPLIKLSPQYSRTWNATSPNYTWSSSAAAWTIDGLSGNQPLDYSKDLWVNVSGKGNRTFTIPDTDEDMSAARLTIAGDKNQTITLGGSGTFRVTDSTVVTNANLTWNVAGGAGRNGIVFVGDPCDLTFEGNAARYVGSKVRNVRNLNVSGLNVTFDSDRNMTENADFSVQNFSFIGSNDVSAEGANGAYNVIRQRVQGFFGISRKIPVVNSRLELQTYNVGGADDSRWQDPLFYLTNAYLRVSYNPYWGTEYFVRPTYLNNGHIVGAYAKFGFGRPGSGSAAAKGYDLYVWGDSSIEGDTPIMITGELRIHLMDASAELTISNPMSDGHGGAAGSIRVMGAGKVRIAGQTTFTGAITVENGAKLELAIAKAVKGDVNMAANCELHLNKIPLDGVRTITLASGSRTYLAQPTGTGIYQMVDPSTASVESENGAVFYDANAPATPLSGVVSEGYFILSDGLRKWYGNSGTWQNDSTKTANWRDGGGNPAGFANTMPVVFGVQSSGNSATVTVSGEVKPGFVSFENANFPYTFSGSGTVTMDSLSSGYDVTFNAALNVDTVLKVRGGTLTAANLRTPLIEISNGGKLHVTGAITEPPQKIKSIKFSFAAAKSSSEKTAIQELRLFRAGNYGINDQFVELPAGTVIEDCAGQKIEILYCDGYEHHYEWLSTPPTSEDESLKALIDGIAESGKNKWWASASSAPTWFTITFPTPVDPIPGYALCAADSAGRNPKTWTVLTSADGTTFAEAGTVADFASEKGNTWLAYDDDYGSGAKSNFGINSVAGSLTVQYGGTLYLQGTLSHNLILEAGAHLAVTGEEYLQKDGGGVAMLTMPDDGVVWVDSDEAKVSANEELILYGYNLSAEQFAKFRCVSDTATLRLSSGNLYIVTSGVKRAPYTATLNSASGTRNWSALDWKDGDNNSFAWNNSTAYRADGEATIAFNGSGAAATVNLDVPGQLGKLHVAGSATYPVTLQWGAQLVPNTLVFSNYAGSVALNYGSGSAYALESANFVAGRDTDIPAASSGTLHIGPGMRALVPQWNYAKVSGAGTLAIKRAARETAVDKATWANDNPVTGTNELYCGTWEIKNGNDYPKGKEVRVGAHGLLKFTTANDTTGYSTYTTGLTVADGGEVNVAKRDTFNRKLTLENGGKLTFTQDASDNGRIYDFYISAELDVAGAATSVIGGSNATSDGDTHDPIVNSGIIALRRDGFPVTVAAGSSLDVFAQWGETSTRANQWTKLGGGVMSLYRATDLTGALTISAGAVRLVNKGQATKGSIVNQGELQLLASNNYEQTVANAISGAGRLVKQGPGTSVLTGSCTYTGGSAVEAGTLRVAANRLPGALALNAGATIDITGEEGLDEYVITTGTFTQGGGIVQLNGTALPAGGYKVSGNKIVRSERPDPNEMYHNQLSAGNEQIKVAQGTYGNIEVPAVGYYATAFNALTKLNASGTGIGGSYANIIKNGTYLDTHTVVGWFNVGALPTGDALKTVYLAKSCNNLDNGYKVAVNAAGKLLVGKINYDGGAYSWNGSNYKTTDAAVVAASNWFHLAVALAKTSGENTVTPAVFVNGASKAIASGTFAGNLNGNSCTDLMIGADVTAAGVYVDTTALSDAAKVASFATNDYYLVKGQEQPGAAAIGGTTYPTLAAAITDVTADQTITLLRDVEENLSAVAKTFTLALDGHTLSGTVDLAATGVITLDLGGGTLASTVTGSGTIVYDATLVTTFPTTAPTGLADNAWTGTVEFRGYTFNGGQVLTDFGNAASKVRMVKCAGYLPQNNPATFAFALELANGDGEYGFNVNNGWSQGIKFAGLSGGGTFKMTKPSGQPTVQYIFTDPSRFQGSIEVNTSGTRMSVVLGDFTYSDSSACFGKILVKGDVTVASGKSWTAVGGIQVDGTIGGAGTLGSATTFGDTAMIVTAGGPLQATAGVTFGSALAVKGVVDDIVLGGLAAAPTLDNVAVTLKDPSTGETVPGDYELSYADGAVRVVSVAPATHFSAYVNGSGNWSALDWSPARPSTGFPADAEFVLTNNATSATLAFDEGIDASFLNLVGNADKVLALNPNSQTVSIGSYTLDAGTLVLWKLGDGVNISKFSGTAAATYCFDIGSGNTMNISGYSTDANQKYGLKVTSGTLNFTESDHGGTTTFNGRTVTADGATAVVKMTNGDATGYANPSAMLVAKNGGKILYVKRDTLRTPVMLDGGTVELASGCSGTSSRGLDLYGNKSGSEIVNNAWTVSGTSAIVVGSGASADDAKILLRNKDWDITVADGGTFTVGATLVTTITSGTADGTRGKLVKKGAGTMVLTAAGTYATGTEVQAGTLKISVLGALGSGAVSVSDGGTLEASSGFVTNALTLVAGATVNVTGEEGQDEYVITTGTFTQGEGTVCLNGAPLPTKDYEVMENKIVKKQQSLLASRVALWNLDLQNDSVKGFCTMTAGSETTIADGKITTKKTSGASGSGYHGVRVDWTSGFSGKDMTVLVKYSGFSMNSGRTSMFSAIWGANASASETTVFETSGNSQIGLGTGVTSSNWSENATKLTQSVPAAGLMLVTLSHSENKVKVSYSTLANSEYGAFSDPFSADYSVDGSFYGIKVGGTVGPYNHFYRPQMTVEGVVIFEGAFDKDSDELATFLSAFETEPANYTAVVTGDVNFSALTWTPTMAAWGMQKGDSFTLNNTADDATVTFDHSVMAAGLAVTSGANKDLTIKNGVNKSAAFSGPFNFADANGKVTLGLATGTGTVTAGADTVLTVMGDGDVTVAAGKTVTLPGGWTTPTKVTGAGDVKIAAAEKTTAVTWGANGITGKNILVSGTWAITAANQYIGAKPFWIKGANAVFKISTNTDVLYGAGTDPIYVEDGGEFQVYKRDTSKRALTLSNGGKLTFDQDKADGYRAYDFYTDSSLAVKGTAPCVIGGLTAGSTVNSGIVAIRRSGFTVTVDEGAELQCYSQWATAAGNGGSFIKAGAGKMVQYRDATSVLPFVVNGGTIQFVNGGRTTTAGITLNDGYKLELSATGDGSYTLSNVISGAGRVEKQDGGTYKLTGANAYTGGTTVKAGTLEVSVPNGSYAIESGATFATAQDLSSGATFVQPTIASNAGSAQFVLTMSRAQIETENPIAVATLDAAITTTGGFSASVVDADTGHEVESVLSIMGTTLCVTPKSAKQSHVFTPESSGQVTWQAGSAIGGKTYRDHDDIAFATTAYTNGVTVVDKVTATTLSVGGTYAFAGSPVIATTVNTLAGADAVFSNDVVATDVVITNGAVGFASLAAQSVAVTNATFASAVVGPSMKFVRLTITETQASGNVPAVAEFRLYRGSAATGYSHVEWPVGTRVSDSNTTVTTTSSDYPAEVGTKNEVQPGTLIDGYYGNDTTDQSLYADWTEQYATHDRKHNKWWPTSQTTGPWVVTIEFPYPVATFAGCNFCLADHGPRNPKSWTIEVSSDGTDWTEINSTTNAVWETQHAWKGGDEDVPAFLNSDVLPTQVALGGGATVRADGNWTADVTVGGAVTIAAATGKSLTLDANSSSKFAAGAAVTFDLAGLDIDDYDDYEKHYILGGKLDNWPGVEGVTVNDPESKFHFLKDAGGYAVILKKEAAIGTTYYFALAKALDAASDGDTVTLCTNVAMTAAYALNKSITLDGGTYEITGGGFTGSGTLTIAGGYIGITGLPSSYSIIGGKYKGKGEWDVASGYRYADLAELAAYENYTKQVIAGEKGKADEKVFPVSTEGTTTTYEGELAFTKAELVEKGVIASASATDAEVTTALNTPQANDLLGWENAILGLKGTETAYKDIPVPVPVQTDDPDRLTIKLGGNVTVDTKAGATVQYRVKIRGSSGTTTTEFKNYDQPFELTLPESGVQYYQFEIAITPAR